MEARCIRCTVSSPITPSTRGLAGGPVSQELRVLAALGPLAVCDILLPWSTEVFLTDAPEGFAESRGWCPSTSCTRPGGRRLDRSRGLRPMAGTRPQRGGRYPPRRGTMLHLEPGPAHGLPGATPSTLASESRGLHDGLEPHEKNPMGGRLPGRIRDVARASGGPRRRCGHRLEAARGAPLGGLLGARMTRVDQCRHGPKAMKPAVIRSNTPKLEVPSRSGATTCLGASSARWRRPRRPPPHCGRSGVPGALVREWLGAEVVRLIASAFPRGFGAIVDADGSTWPSATACTCATCRHGSTWPASPREDFRWGDHDDAPVHPVFQMITRAQRERPFRGHW